MSGVWSTSQGSSTWEACANVEHPSPQPDQAEHDADAAQVRQVEQPEVDSPDDVDQPEDC